MRNLNYSCIERLRTQICLCVLSLFGTDYHQSLQMISGMDGLSA